MRDIAGWRHDDEQVTDVQVPQYHELLWPMLTAVSRVGRSIPRGTRTIMDRSLHISSSSPAAPTASTRRI